MICFNTLINTLMQTMQFLYTSRLIFLPFYLVYVLVEFGTALSMTVQVIV